MQVTAPALPPSQGQQAGALQTAPSCSMARELVEASTQALLPTFLKRQAGSGLFLSPRAWWQGTSLCCLVLGGRRVRGREPASFWSLCRSPTPSQHPHVQAPPSGTTQQLRSSSHCCHSQPHDSLISTAVQSGHLNTRRIRPCRDEAQSVSILEPNNYSSTTQV